MVKFFFKYLILLLLFFIIEKQECTAQKITWKLLFGQKELVLDTVYKLNATDSVQLTTLKFYISNIQFSKLDSLLSPEKNSCHLLDLTSPERFSLQFDAALHRSFNQIKFSLGIDSITNVAGAMSGALDPINAMYWTWQSGYVNTKIEGYYYSGGNKQFFQFHLGGYQHPYNALQEIVLSVDSKSDILINFDLMDFFSALDFKNLHSIMQPSFDAVLLSRNLKKCFSIK